MRRNSRNYSLHFARSAQPGTRFSSRVTMMPCGNYQRVSRHDESDDDGYKFSIEIGLDESYIHFAPLHLIDLRGALKKILALGMF